MNVYWKFAQSRRYQDLSTSRAVVSRGIRKKIFPLCWAYDLVTRWDRNSTITNSRDLEQQLGSVICLLHQKARTILFLCFLIEISSTPHFILWNYSFVMFNWGDGMFWFYACLVHSANVCRELLSHSCWPYAPGIWESICPMGMVVHITEHHKFKNPKFETS